jgi:uracil-DNA glycosylase
VSDEPSAHEEPAVHDELAGLTADLRTWLEIQRGQGARQPQGALPLTTLGPQEEEPPPRPAPPPPPPVRVTAAPPRSEPARPPAPIAAMPEPPPPSHDHAPPPTTIDVPAAALDRPTGSDLPEPGTLASVENELGVCFRCKLHKGRTNIVFGVGSETADVVFVGEGPGYHEDRLGEPFVGKAGDLLTRIIENVLRLQRDDVYICNVVKCRPPNNRDPEPDEVAACSPYLWKQLEVMKPAVVVGLGRFAVQTLLETRTSIGRLRGSVHAFRDACLVPTYHPAYLLRNPDDKRKVFQDMLLVRQEYEKRTGRALPPVRSAREARQK